jgi:signal peptidase II
LNPRVRDILITIACFAIDQATKYWASRLDSFVQVIPSCLRFELAHNTGAMFSLFDNWSDPWRTLLLTGLPVLAIPVIGWVLLKTPLHERCARPGLALILGGALGNVLDRILHGHVIDFIVAYAGWVDRDGWLIRTFGTNQWPTFNIADTGLCVGAGLLLIEVFRKHPTREP